MKPRTHCPKGHQLRTEDGHLTELARRRADRRGVECLACRQPSKYRDGQHVDRISFRGNPGLQAYAAYTAEFQAAKATAEGQVETRSEVS